MDRNDDMNLDELKDFLSDVPDDGGFDLESIIAEVEGRAPAAPTPEPEPEPAKAAPVHTAEPAREPSPVQTAPKVKTAPKTKAAPVEPVEAETEPAEDPRAARIAAREAKAAEHEQKAAEKRAERRAKREEKLAEREEKQAEKAAKAAAAPKKEKAERVSRKQARAERLAAEQEEENEDIEVLDPDQSARVFRRRSAGLNARSILVLILAAAAAYLSLAPNFTQLPLPSVIDIVANPTLGIGALLLLQLLAMLIGVDIFSMGFSELLHGRPCRETLVSVAIIAAILHSVSLIVFPEQNGVTTPYIAATILLLYAMMREDRARYAARSRSYKAVAQADRPVAVYSHYDEVDDACRAAKGPLFNKNDFLTELERPDTVDRFSMIYAPLALALSIILALVSSLGRGEPVRFFWAFSAVTAVAAPIGLLCAFGAGYKNIARRLLASGAAIAGARQANLLRGTEEVVLAENDLFPTGSIELESIKAVGQMSEERILSFATSLTTAAGLELGRTLDAAARQHAIVPLSAQDVRAVEGGLTGHVGSSYVVLGTGALMVNMGITIPAEGDTTTMYLLADNQLVGIIALRYMPTKNTYKAMRLMRRMHMNAVIAALDFNVSPAMVEEEFDLRRGFADQPDPAGVRRLLDPSYAKGDAPAAILTREGAGPFMQVLRCADKLAGAVRSALTLSTFAGLFGILIVFYLVFQNQAAALPVQHLLLYLLIWYIPVFIINQQAR